MRVSAPACRRSIPTCWRLARLENAGQSPAAGDWIPAVVPGAVQLDWARARGLPDPHFGQNVRLYAGLEDFHWLYRTTVPAAHRRAGERLFFVCEGVDFACELRIDGVKVLAHQGMQSGFDYDVSGLPEGAVVDLLVFPAPKRHAEPADRSQASHVTKPAVSYGWDFHPRLIPLGLWQPAGFEIRPAVAIRHVDFAYTLADDFSAAQVRLTVETSPPGGEFRWRLSDAKGAVFDSATDAGKPNAGEVVHARIERPRLWWTHDQGDPELYELEVELPDGDCVRRRVGFRRVKLVMHAGAWEEDMPFPRSQNPPPITLELNGRRIFVKGSNWVATDIFPGLATGETYRPLLQLARDAHLNLLRCWGGAAAPKEPFFDLCDELGLLVWQEFPLACNLYPDDGEYLELLDRESRALIRRVRQHPCLGLWCGGNELFNAWSRMTAQSLPLRLLDRNCYDLDPATPFLMTAPVSGMGHGDYRFRAEGREILAIFQSARCTAYSEFGCPGASPVEVLRSIIPADEWWPPRPGTSWETHHAFGAWDAEPTSHLCLSAIEHYFGPSSSVEEMVARGSWLQTEGLKGVFEEARRQQPRCSMALNWCFNEPWPSAANNSLVNWPTRPKPAYAGVAAACRPVLASARIPKFQWRAGESFSAELWLLNDEPKVQPGGEMRATLAVGGERLELAHWTFPPVPAQSVLRGPDIRGLIPEAGASEFALQLDVTPHRGWASAYRLSLSRL